MNGYNEKGHYDDEPEPGNFVRAFDAFRKCALLLFTHNLSLSRELGRGQIQPSRKSQRS